MTKQFFEPTLLEKFKIGTFCYYLKPKKRLAQVNKAFLKIFGYRAKEEFRKISLERLFINKKDFVSLLKVLTKQKRVDFYETTCLTKRRKVIWVAISARLYCPKKGSQYIEGIIQDISSFKEHHERISHESDALQAVLDSIPDAIYFKDTRNRITLVNKFYAQGFGGRLEKIIGKTDFDFFPEDQAKHMFTDDNYILKTGNPIVGKVERTLLPNGTWNQVITTKIPMFDSNGKITGTMGITRDMTAHANLEKERLSMVLNALMVLGRALEMRDPYTQSHARDVGLIAQKIGEELNFDEDQLMCLKISAELHDLGKIGIPLDILIKPGKLSDLEYRLIKEHTGHCYNLIKGIDFSFPLAEIIYQHHERLDGSGYPRKLKGKAILKEARILAVSDVLEAMTHHRPYRAALGIKKAIRELKKGSGIKYDAEIVAVALNLIKKNGGKPFWRNSRWAKFRYS